MSTTRFSLAALASNDKKKSNNKQMYAIALCSYGDWRKKFFEQQIPLLHFVCTGKLELDANGDFDIEAVKKFNNLAGHRKAGDTVNTTKDFKGWQDMHGNELGNCDGWLVCEKKDIKVLTEAIQAFNNHDVVKQVKLNECITLLPDVFEYHKEVTDDTKVDMFKNEYITAE